MDEPRPALLRLGPATAKSNATLTIQTPPAPGPTLIDGSTRVAAMNFAVNEGQAVVILPELQWHISATAFGALVGGIIGTPVDLAWFGGAAGAVLGYFWGKDRWKRSQGR